MKEFYVYKWYIKSTNEVFYVGKGTGNRCNEVTRSRNQLFQNIVKKHKDDVAVSIICNNLTEEEAFLTEKKLISDFWSKGLCRANFHAGGRGGNTGHYDNPERSFKLSQSAKKRVGQLNPMYGKHHTEETKQYLRQINQGKKITEEHKQKLIKANKGRPKTQKEIEFIRNLNKGKKMPAERFQKMMDTLCTYKYEVVLNNEKVYECLGRKALYSFCQNTFGISRTIVNEIIANKWKCKFQKHQKLKTLRIYTIKRGVTTNGDECSRVG